MSDDSGEFILSKQSEPYVPEWLKNMRAKIDTFSNANEQLKQNLQDNDQKIKVFNSLQKNEMRKQIYLKYNKKQIRLKLYHLPYRILYNIILFTKQDILKTIHILGRVNKKLAIILFQNLQFWRLIAEHYLPKDITFINPQITNWKQVLQYFMVEYKQAKETIMKYREIQCPKIVTKYLSQSLVKFCQFVQQFMQFSLEYEQFQIKTLIFKMILQKANIYAILRLMLSQINVAKYEAFKIVIQISWMDSDFFQKSRDSMNWRKQISDEKIALDITKQDIARSALLYFSELEKNLIIPIYLQNKFVTQKFNLQLRNTKQDQQFVKNILDQQSFYQGQFTHHMDQSQNVQFEVSILQRKDVYEGFFFQDKHQFNIQFQLANIEQLKDFNTFGQGSLEFFTFGSKKKINIYVSILFQQNFKRLIIYGSSQNYSIYLIN